MNTEKRCIEAFNNGYVLNQFEPDLSDTLFRNLTPSNSYLRGLIEGKKQVELEKSDTKMFELEQLRDQSKGKDKDFERD